MQDSHPYYLAGKPVRSGRFMAVANKHTGQTLGQVCMADAAAIEHAIIAAAAAAGPLRRLAAFQRKAALEHVVAGLIRRRDEFVGMIRDEAGKPISAAAIEVDRAIDTFRIASEESTRIPGQIQPLDTSPRNRGMMAIIRRVPVGPCSFITPFNFPLNLVAHKVAPALAAGCPFILKPAPQTPITAILLAEILAECDLPAGAFSVLPCEVADAQPLVSDDRIKLLSFTGSSGVGWDLKSKAGKKRVVLELGGNAACIVDADASIEQAVPRIIFGAFYQSGQSCISVQRLLVHDSIYEPLKSELVREATELKLGDANDPATLLGPMISERDAVRIEQWVREAVAGGGRLLCGGRRSDAFHQATIVENCPTGVRLRTEEAFGPVLTIEPFSDFGQAIAAVNSSRYGLQAGVFTNNLEHARHAFDELEVGGIIINDVPSTRVDSMPYGGVKDSGLGREGVRFAMEEMSELRTMVLKGL